MPAITPSDLNNAKLDVDHIAAIATSASPTATDRLGNTKLTITGVIASAVLDAQFYDTIALGRAAVADGQKFGAVAGGSDGLTRPTVYRRDSGSTQTLLYEIATAPEIDAVSIFPGRSAATAAEKAAMARVLRLELYGANPAKFYSVKVLYWKDVGTRFHFIVVQHDDADGTNPVEVCSCNVASGADTWTTLKEITLAQLASSGITGTAILDFTSSTALTVNTVSSSSAMYRRRQINTSTLTVGAARTADIAAQAAAVLLIRNRTATVSAFVFGGNDTQSGSYNIGFGPSAAAALTSGTYNTVFGYSAAAALTTASYNSVFGQGALSSSTTGGSNTAVGWQNLKSLTSGSNNSSLGQHAGYNITTGIQNAAFGVSALFSLTTGGYCTAFGSEALYSCTVSGNTAVGEGAARGATTASNLTAIGRRAAYGKTTGGDCTYVGNQAGYSGLPEVNTGVGVTAIGAYSYGHSTSGSYNTGCGRASGWYVTTGSNNSYLGYRCGYGNTTGNNNIAIGFYSGHNTSAGDYNCFLGAYTDALVPALGSMSATAVAGSGLSIGAYTYRFTFVLDGVETGVCEASASATTTGGNQQINLAAIPVYSGPRTCSARKLYRTPVGGEHLLYLVATIADNTTTTYADTVADVSLGAVPTSVSSSIALGYGAQVLKSNQMVVGSVNSKITELYVGGGVDDTSPQAVTHSASNGSGTNVAGAAHRIRGGKSTGSAIGGSVILAASPPGSSGAAANPATDWVELDGRGFLNIKETSSAAVPTPAAGSVNLFVESGALKFRNSAGTVLTVTAV
jgi:hypothetical protein